jgi:predicted transposase YbfD/YdcC
VRKWAAEYVREQLDVPDCRSLIRVDKEIRRKGKTPVLSTRYYISSLDPDKVSASEFQTHILGHWEVENCLHMLKDRDCGEDKHVCGSDWGKQWSILTNMALSLAQLFKRGERTLREVRERCAAKPTIFAKKLGWQK